MKIKYFLFGFFSAFIIIIGFFYYVYQVKQEPKLDNEEIMFNIIKLNDFNLDIFQNIESTTIKNHDEHDFYVINYWATWCKPCVNEMPSLIKLSEKKEFKDVKFVLATDETKDRVQKFIEKKNINNRKIFYLYNKNNCNIQLENKYLPTTYIVDRKKMFAYKISGEVDFNSKNFHNALLTITKQ